MRDTEDQQSPEGPQTAVEDTYRKMTPIDHILLRPDSYVGSVEPVSMPMWVLDTDVVSGCKKLCYRIVSFTPGFLQVFDELLINAADHKRRDSTMNIIKVSIDRKTNSIEVFNNGNGIPIVEYREEELLPTVLFSHLFTSSNYDDDDKRQTGGRNGYGAKLCNLFSSRFEVETCWQDDKTYVFKQVWRRNMAIASKPVVRKKADAEPYTKIIYRPDLTKFGMNVIDEDAEALLALRAYDIAAIVTGVKVFINEWPIPVRSFKEYVETFVREESTPPLFAYEETECWQVAVTMSPQGQFIQRSFVNAILTLKGGTHVDYITEQVVQHVLETVKRTNKTAVRARKADIRRFLWLFVNCLINNPSFESQTKERLTTPVRLFGSTCQLSAEFFKQLASCGIYDSCTSWITLKGEQQLRKLCPGRKLKNIRGIPKLEDADYAGTARSLECSLIVTEGDSAKSLAVAGLSVVGRQLYGVYPLRGKILNVRDASQKQLVQSWVINDLIKILGLKYHQDYSTQEDTKSLRYGKLLIMTDQDPDGSHIKGLIINLFHCHWPSLLQNGFLEEFITPIVKVTHAGTERCFYSLSEYDEWKTETEDSQNWKIKYYKGLGTSTPKEAKAYFSDMGRHRVSFIYHGVKDDDAIKLAFSKGMASERKEWLIKDIKDRQSRRLMGMPEPYLYKPDTNAVTVEEFVKNELVVYSNIANERAIPSLIDGLKPGQRKVVFTCFKRNDKKEIKVAQLAGSVAECSAYRHGEDALMSTIITMAQDFVGSNNINILLPIGQFGTRQCGGKDAASARYISTMLSNLARLIMPVADEPILTFCHNDDERIEPSYYIPILPMVLVNGAQGIGTGWRTSIPNFNPHDIVDNLRKLMAGAEPAPMKPWYKNFRGSVDQVGPHKFLVSGEVAVLDSHTIEITELPIRVWTQVYKETVLEKMLHGTSKTPPLIENYREYHTDSTVRFVVSMSDENMKEAKRNGFHRMFKLQRTLTTTSMVLHDSHGVLRTYSTPEDILREFFTTRLQAYQKRKNHAIEFISAEARHLDNRARFVQEKLERKIQVEDVGRDELVATLQRRGYDPDPILVLKKQRLHHSGNRDHQGDAQHDVDTGTEIVGALYNYILAMPLWSLTTERKHDLLKKRDDKHEELETLRHRSPESMWEEELNAFITKLDQEEEAKRAEDMKTRGSKGTECVNTSETQPSPFGVRIVPEIRVRRRTTTGARLKAKKAVNEANANYQETGPSHGWNEDPSKQHRAMSTSSNRDEETKKGDKASLRAPVSSCAYKKTAPSKQVPAVVSDDSRGNAQMTQQVDMQVQPSSFFDDGSMSPRPSTSGLGRVSSSPRPSTSGIARVLPVRDYYFDSDSDDEY